MLTQVEAVLGMDIDQGTYFREVVYPFRIRDGQIHATMAHRGSKIVVPVGPMNRVALVVIHRPWHTRQVIPRAGHWRRFQLDVDPELTRDGGMGRGSGRHDE